MGELIGHMIKLGWREHGGKVVAPPGVEAGMFDSWAEAIKACIEEARDAARLDWLAAHPREASMRFDDGTFKSVKSWAIAADPKWTLREAIDAAMAEEGKHG